MEDKTKPMASQPSPDDDRSAAFDAQASEESKPAGDPVDKPAEPAAPKAAPVEAPAAPKESPAEAPVRSEAPKTAPVSAPQSPADSVDKPAEPAAPKGAPDAAPAVPAEAPAQPAAPKVAPVEPPVAPVQPMASAAAPVPPAPKAPPAAAPASAPAAAPTQPMGTPAQPGGPAPQPAAAPMGAYPPPPAPNAPVSNSNKATVALVCGILAIVFSFIPIAGIILGIVAIVFAGKATRMFGHSGKATGGKVCGILGIVFSVLMIVFTVAVMMFGYSVASSIDEAYEDTPAYVSSSNESSSWSSAAGAVDMDKDQQAVYDQVTVLFDGIVAKDAKFKDELSEEYGESFEQNFGATYAEMGIDPAAFAEWALTDFSYEIDSVFVEGDTATVYVDTTERDTFQFLMNFGDAVAAYSQTIDAGTVSDVDAKAKVAELFNQTMAETAETTTYFAAFDFKKQGDAWVIDEESAEEEFDYMFGTF
ncbi:MAG: hypothetical protein Q4E80_03280 [Slackia faecicanis]|nr:hypothetical protein [Slackia faecicanis]